LRVSARLFSTRATSGPAGYTGFEHPYIGIVLAGYSNGLRPAPVRINGRPQRLLEVGMNSSFVSLDAADQTGDEVVLLGDDLSAEEVAAALGCRPHEVHCRYAALGIRQYRTAVRGAVARVSASG
jgi:alanine racemase